MSIDYLFTFQKGRVEKLNQNDYSYEFFYSYDFIPDDKKDLYEIGELEINKFLNLFLSKLNYFVVKLTKLNINLKSTYSPVFKQKISNSNVVVATSYPSGLSIIFWKLLGIYKIKKIVVINSGLFQEPNLYSFQKVLRNIFLNYFLKNISFLIFTSFTEYNFANNNYSRFKDKFICLEFSVDTKFWMNKVNEDKRPTKNILFIGNNGYRDFSMLSKLPSCLPNFKFTYISSSNILLNSKHSNLTTVEGDWSKSLLTDRTIKDYYINADLTILPITETLVSSGQSVALQSIAAGTPVLISSYTGFWNFEKFRDMENIYFCNEKDENNWSIKIKNILEDENVLEEVAAKGRKTVLNYYNKTIFDEKFFEILENLKNK